MRKIILVFICILIGDVLAGKDLNNKKYINEIVEIDYPVFANKMIDDYINNYLNFKVNKNGNIFIDYDYHKDNNIIDISFYNYTKIGNLVNYNVDNYKINLLSNKILKKNYNNQMNNYNYLVQDIIDSSKPMIALTFDDGPNYNTSKMIDVLNKYNVRATFFVLGMKASNNPGIIKKMFDSNMEIGNHTYSHKLLLNMKSEKIKLEIEKTSNIINSIIGEEPKLLRTSYGSVNKKIKKNANLPIILWNIDTLDWKYHNSKRIANNILKKVKDGDIILLHDIYSASVNAVDIVIPKLLEKEFQVVTVSELAYYKNKQFVKNKVYRSIK